MSTPISSPASENPLLSQSSYVGPDELVLSSGPSWRTLFFDPRLRIGWAVFALSALLFGLYDWLHSSRDAAMGFFVVHFILAVGYRYLPQVVATRVPEHREHYRTIGALLFLISTYALNREFEVFAASPLWLRWLLCVSAVNYLATPFSHLFPPVVRTVHGMVLGISFSLFLYLAIYLIPLYPISVLGLILFGMSVHSYVPAYFLYHTVRLLRQAGSRAAWWAFGSGLLASVLLCLTFTLIWQQRARRVNDAYSEAITEGTDALPLWIQVAQKIDNDWMTEKVLKTTLLYKTTGFDNLLWSMPQRSFGEEQPLHDPLVLIASYCTPEVRISEEDRIRILESQYGARHQTLDRLWSGRSLRTEEVTSKVRVWPSMHLAYTEMAITVGNTSARMFNGSEEAIYTLHLPEGAAVTALSLWINGTEAKGILSTRSRADSAYRTIVGVESRMTVRDPSLVHWQEGNTVSLRVFPVAAGGNRVVRVGVTAPLRKEGKKLVYDKIWIEGPDASKANERVTVDLQGTASALHEADRFSTTNGSIFTRSGAFEPRWSLTFDDPGIVPHRFSFDGHTYSLSARARETEAAAWDRVYLDINAAWSDRQLDEVWQAVKDRQVYVYDGELRQVTESNRGPLFRSLQRQSFSLFPFQLIQQPERSVIVSASPAWSPNLKDLKESAFLAGLKSRAADLSRLRLFLLGSEVSPYLRSLIEFRLFDVDRGDPARLKELAASHRFLRNAESDSSVVVHSADVQITRTKGASSSNAPDHLMRLFTYNNILRQLGPRGLTGNLEDPDLVRLADEAYVVSPVSSLVVLETQADYDRFDIQRSKTGLGNASMKNTGAVPEPHEWALIILVVVSLAVFLFKWKLI